MYGNPVSDTTFPMAASHAFEEIINPVVASNLYFFLEQSPFSAVIHLKKSVIINRSGTPLIPPPPLFVQLLLQTSSEDHQS